LDILMFVRFISAVLLALSLAAVAPAQAPATDLVASADALLSAGKYQEALDAYLAVTRTDSRNAAAQHGAGRAYAALGQSVLATKAFERALLISPKDRVIVHNAALALFRNDTQPRALKLIKDYLSATTTPADEPLLETVRYMLANASDETKKSRLYTDLDNFAQQYAKSLERQRPGFAKWGSDWITTKDAAEKAAANKTVQAQIDVISDRIKLIERDMLLLDRRTAELEGRVRRGIDARYVLDQHLDKIRALGDQRSEAMRERLTIMERLAQPPAPVEPVFLAMGTPAPELPSVEVLIARTAPPAPPPDAVPGEQVPDVPGNEAPIASNPPDAPRPLPPAPPDKVAKRVTRYGVAFAISQDTLVTSNDLVSGAFDITVQSPQGTTDEGKIIKSDPATGLSLIRITKLKAAALRIAVGFDGGAIECIGMPNVDLFRPHATVIGGQCKTPTEPWTVSLDKNPRLPGAPLMSDGKVVGVTLATRDTEANAVPAVTLKRLSDLVANDMGAMGAFTNDPKAAVFQIVATHESK
jgi:tetratricopeptide (TPR) repeat protein